MEDITLRRLKIKKALKNSFLNLAIHKLYINEGSVISKNYGNVVVFKIEDHSKNLVSRFFDPNKCVFYNTDVKLLEKY